MCLIYKLDPRTKILLVFAFTILIFIVDKLAVAAAVMFVFLLFRLLGGVPFKRVKSFWLFLMLASFITLLQIFFAPGENYIVKPLFPPSLPVLGGKGSLKWDGLVLGLTISCRLAALTFLLPFLTFTTSPYSIAAGLAAFGVNYRAAFVITTAFNMIPVFEEEARAIMDAQKLRGSSVFEKQRKVRLHAASFIGKLKAYPSLVVPLVLGAMRKAQVSSAAMDSRAFGVYKTRSWLEKPEMKAYDYAFLAAGFIFASAVLYFNFL